MQPQPVPRGRHTCPGTHTLPQHGPSRGQDTGSSPHTRVSTATRSPAPTQLGFHVSPGRAGEKNSPAFPFWFSSRQIICKCRNRQKLYPVKEGDVWEVVRAPQGLGWLESPIQSCCLGSQPWPCHGSGKGCASPQGCAHTTRGAVLAVPCLSWGTQPLLLPPDPGTAQHPTALCASCRSSQLEWTVPHLLPPGCERLWFSHSNFHEHPESFLLPFLCPCSEDERAWEQPEPRRAGMLPGCCTVTFLC